MSKHIGSSLNEFLEEEGVLAHTEGVAIARIEPPKDFNLHINHPTLGNFIIRREGNNGVAIHELDELFAFIKNRAFGCDQHNQSADTQD